MPTFEKTLKGVLGNNLSFEITTREVRKLANRSGENLPEKRSYVRILKANLLVEEDVPTTAAVEFFREVANELEKNL